MGNYQERYKESYRKQREFQKQMQETIRQQSELQVQLEAQQKRQRAAATAEAHFQERKQAKEEQKANYSQTMLAERGRMKTAADTAVAALGNSEVSAEEFQGLQEQLRTLNETHAVEKAKRGYPESYDAISRLPEAAKEEVRGRVNRLFAEKGLGSLEELEEKGRQLHHQQSEDYAANAFRGQSLELQFAAVRLSDSLLSHRGMEKLDAFQAEVMKKQLDVEIQADPQLQAALGSVGSVDDFLKEEDELGQAQAAVNRTKDDEVLKALHGFTFTAYGKMEPGKQETLRREIGQMLDAYKQEAGADRMGSQSGEEFFRGYLQSVEREEQTKALLTALDTGDKRKDVVAAARTALGAPSLQAAARQYQEALRTQAALTRVRKNSDGVTQGRHFRFTQLRKTEKENPLRYDAIVEQIDGIIASHTADPIPGISSLKDYFELESRKQRAQEEAKKKAAEKGAEDVATSIAALTVKKQFEDAKAKIKEWIDAHDDALEARAKADKKQKKAADQQRNAADQAVKEAEERLIEAVKQQRTDSVDALRSEAEKLEAENREKKRFIKTTVIEGTLKKREESMDTLQTVHEQHKKALQKRIEAYNETMAGEAARIQEAMRQSTELQTKTRQREEEYRSRVSRADAALKEAGSELKREQGADWEREDRLYEESRGVFERAILSQEKGLEKQKKAREKAVAEYQAERAARMRSAYRSAAAQKLVFGAAVNVIDTAQTMFRDLVAATAAAAIRGEEQEVLDQLKEAGDTHERQQQALFAAVNSTALGGGQKSLSQLVSEENRGDGLNKRMADMARQVEELNRQLEQVRLEQPERIQQSLESIDEAFCESKAVDQEEMRLADTMIREIILEASKEDPRLQAIVQERIRQSDAEMERLVREDEQQAKAMQESRAKIEERSKALMRLFTESSLSSIDKVAKVGQGIVNFMIDRVNDAAGQGEPMAHIDLSGKLTELKQSLEEEKAPEEHLAIQLLEVGKLLYGEMKTAADALNERYRSILDEFDTAEMGFEGIQEEQKRFQAFISEKPEPGKDLLEQWQAFYEHVEGEAEALLGERLQEAAAQEQLATKKKEEETAKTASHTEAIEQKREAAQELNQEIIRQVEAIQQLYSETVLENKEQLNGTVSVELSEVFKDGNEWEFLSALTGTAMTETMEPEDAVMAFGRISVNGMNAASWFGISEDYRNLMEGDLQGQELAEARKQMMENIKGCAADLKSAFQAAFDPSRRQNLNERAGQLSGQMIAVENERMGLSAVQLHDDRPKEPEKPVLKAHETGWFKKGINAEIDEQNRQAREAYDRAKAEYDRQLQSYSDGVAQCPVNQAALNTFNRNSRLTAETFNQIRVETAEKTLIAPVQTQGRKKASLTSEELMARAVHQSRDIRETYKTHEKTEKKEAEKKAPVK